MDREAVTADADRVGTSAGPSSNIKTYKRFSTEARLSNLKRQPMTLYSSNKRGSFGHEERLHSQKISSSENLREIGTNDCSMVFDDFKSSLLQRENINSTFCPNDDVVLVSGKNRNPNSANTNTLTILVIASR